MTFTPMNAGTKIIALTGILLMGMAIISVTGINTTGILNESNDKMFSYEFMGISYVKEANIDLITAARALRNAAYFAEFSDVDKYKQDMRQAIERADKNLEAAIPLFGQAEQKKQIFTLRQDLYLYGTKAEVLMREMNEGVKSTESRKNVAEVLLDLRTIENKVDDALTDITKIKYADGELSVKDATQLYQNSTLLTCGILVLSIAIGFGVFTTHPTIVMHKHPASNTALTQAKFAAREAADSATHVARPIAAEKEPANDIIAVPETIDSIETLHNKNINIQSMMVAIGNQAKAIDSLIDMLIDEIDKPGSRADVSPHNANEDPETTMANKASSGEGVSELALMAKEVQNLAKKTMRSTPQSVKGGSPLTKSELALQAEELERLLKNLHGKK